MDRSRHGYGGEKNAANVQLQHGREEAIRDPRVT